MTAAVQAPKAKPTNPVELISMDDGRKVEFSGKRKMIKTVDCEPGKQAAVRFDFRNGESRIFKIPHDLLHQLAAHGASQKIGDEAAGEEDVEDMLMAVDNIMERLNRGEWKAARESSGDGYKGGSVVVRAIAEVTGKTKAAVQKFLDDKLAAYEAQGQNVSRQALYKSFRRPDTEIGRKIAELEATKASKAPVIEIDLDELSA
jgi:hypothetical protein